MISKRALYLIDDYGQAVEQASVIGGDDHDTRRMLEKQHQLTRYIAALEAVAEAARDQHEVKARIESVDHCEVCSALRALDALANGEG